MSDTEAEVNNVLEAARSGSGEAVYKAIHEIPYEEWKAVLNQAQEKQVSDRKSNPSLPYVQIGADVDLFDKNMFDVDVMYAPTGIFPYTLLRERVDINTGKDLKPPFINKFPNV